MQWFHRGDRRVLQDENGVRTMLLDVKSEKVLYSRINVAHRARRQRIANL